MTSTHITQTTHCFTLQQLRAATQAGGVAGVSLKGHGNGFFIQIQLRTGQQAVLVTARSNAPRMFKGPAQAFSLLRGVGIVTGSFDVTHYTPEQQQTDNIKSSNKITKKTAKKKPRAKKISTLAPTTAPVITEPDTAQPSLVDPRIQIDEDETKRLKKEQKEKPMAVQQSLI